MKKRTGQIAVRSRDRGPELDQNVIKQIFKNTDIVDLKNGEWIRHFDVKTAADERAHAKCLIYHAKGLRGKQKPVGITWTDIK